MNTITTQIQSTQDLNNIPAERFGFNNEVRHAIVKFSEFYERKNANVLVVLKSGPYQSPEDKYVFSVLNGKTSIRCVLDAINELENLEGNVLAAVDGDKFVTTDDAVDVMLKYRSGQEYPTIRALANCLKGYMKPAHRKALNNFARTTNNVKKSRVTPDDVLNAVGV